MKGADHLQIVEKEEQGDQCEKHGKHQAYQEEVVDELTTRKSESSEDISGHRGDEQGPGQRPSEHDHRVEEIAPDVRFAPGARVIAPVERLWEFPRTENNVRVRFEGGHDHPQERKD